MKCSGTTVHQLPMLPTLNVNRSNNTQGHLESTFVTRDPEGGRSESPNLRVNWIEEFKITTVRFLEFSSNVETCKCNV